MALLCAVPQVGHFRQGQVRHRHAPACGSLLHGGVNPGFFPRWIQLAGQCFPAALILQVFYIGPLVRWLFRLLFRRNEKAAARN